MLVAVRDAQLIVLTSPPLSELKGWQLVTVQEQWSAIVKAVSPSLTIGCHCLQWRISWHHAVDARIVTLPVTEWMNWLSCFKEMILNISSYEFEVCCCSCWWLMAWNDVLLLTVHIPSFTMHSSSVYCHWYLSPLLITYWLLSLFSRCTYFHRQLSFSLSRLGVYSRKVYVIAFCWFHILMLFARDTGTYQTCIQFQGVISEQV